MYKFMSNYRQIIHVRNIDVCEAFRNAASNMFFKNSIIQLKDDYPDVDFNCPLKVIETLLIDYLIGML